ncbi:MAG: glutamine synthetase family protein [Infirmifilum sp.]
MQPAELVDPEEALRNFSKEDIRYVSIIFQDLEGWLRERLIRANKLKSLCEETRVDGYSIGFMPVEDSDLILKPDPSTARLLESPIGKTLVMVGDLYYESRPLPHYPRHILREALRGAHSEARVGLEVEFYLTTEGKPVDRGYYWSPILLQDVVGEVVLTLEKAGVEVRSVHHEVGPGQYEVLPGPMPPLAAADTILIMKKVIHSIAHKNGYNATFMPKPFAGLPGSGLHLHLSLHRDGKNILFEDGAVTEDGQAFIAGLLANARNSALLTNPTVNSYKRLTPGYEAPVLIAWGVGNRSVLVRVPRGSKGFAGTVEYRLPDSSGNVYLAITAAVLAGLQGVRERLKPPPPCNANAYNLKGLEAIPRTLGEAVEHASNLNLFEGEARKTIQMLANLKLKEWEDYLKATKGQDSAGITQWEIEKYFER